MDRLEYARKQKGENLSSSPIGPWMRTDQPAPNFFNKENQCDNITQFFDRVVAKYSKNKAFGQRPILAEDDDVQANGRVFKKFVLGDYQWMTYKEAQKRIK